MERFNQVEPREIGDLVFMLKLYSIVLKQETNEFQHDSLVLNHIEATVLRDWLNSAIGEPP